MNKINYLNTRLKFCACLMLVLGGCSQYERDRQIKADITIKAKNDVNFAGLQYTVKDGIVRLTGKCPNEKSHLLVKQLLQSIHVIDSIDDQVKIMPVELGAHFAIKLSVDSILAVHPQMKAEITDTTVVVTGRAHGKEIQSIKDAIEQVNRGRNLYQITQL
jgi:6-phosphofructokinase